MRFVSTPFRLALVYLAFSALWILTTDQFAISIAGHDPVLLQQMQSFKGLLFVVLCACLFYFVTRSFYNNTNRSLKKSEEMLNRYRALTEATKEGIADIDLVRNEATINAQLQDFLALNSSCIRDFFDLLEKRTHPDDWKRISTSFVSTLQSQHNIWHSECRLMWNDDTYHDVIYSGHIMRDEQTGNALRFICAFQDVSELRSIQTNFYQKQLKQKQSLGITIIKAQEEERDRWALELHDNICQVLTVAKLYLDELTTVYPDKMIPKTKDMVHNSLKEIRQLSASLKPPSFDTSSLQESIEELHGNMARVSSFKFELADEDLDEALLNEDQKLMIYRIVQEQLSNITKYADADYVKVKLWNVGNQCCIEVSDDGKGCETEKITTGIGLRNIQNRLQVFNGKMELKTSPGRGCTLVGTFQIQ